eukprot:TRINITY_DN23180_c0_g1_i1.p1 TRINITY_DN23180_c0_g1~~TRINITY_DN23180_c0_g1_i1.p1  ORF type:complete len:122 (+),score=26.11 TRINITY_DN23180_c0_g1_i1:55-366(+)
MGTKKLKTKIEMLISCELWAAKISKQHVQNSRRNNDFHGMLLDGNKDKELIKATNESESSAVCTEDGVSSLCLIKPHALSSTPSIIEDILNEGFFVTAITTKN